jgi:LacI family transcriptional regulator
MPLTLEEIGKLAGVSRSTVSRVVNGSANVSEVVRERVGQVIHQTGYHPHAAARSLVTHRTRVIGVVIPEALTKLFTDPFFPLLLRGVTETCNSHDYHLMLSLFSGPDGQFDMHRRVIRSGYLDGVIMASTRLDDPLVARLLQDKVALVMVGRHPDERVNYVDTDNLGAARMATEHLIRLGHKKIATLTGPLNMLQAQDRVAGFRQAMDAHRYSLPESLVVEGDFTEGSGYEGMTRLLAVRPSAVFAASDAMAVGALKAIRHAGLRVPDDIALVGFDDVPIAEAIEPALTTVRQPIERLGSMATELLLTLIEAGSSEEPRLVQRIVLPAELIVRQSCGALR